MTALNLFSIVVAGGSILLVAWQALDRYEVRRQRARLAEDVNTRKRMRPVIAITEWRRK